MASSKTKTDKTNASQAAPGGKTAKHAAAPAKASKPAAKAGKDTAKKDAKKGSAKGGKPGLLTRVKTYFKNVRTEVKRVVWPTKPEMVKYTGAVLGMLVFFGILIAVVDAVIVPALYAFSGLR